jgi:hypothetical protein
VSVADPTVDALFERQRSTFDAGARKQVLFQLMSKIQEEAPVAFLWRHRLLWGVAPGVDWTPRADEAILGSTTRLR